MFVLLYVTSSTD